MDNLRDKLSFLSWPDSDPRWKRLNGHLERVKNSGIAVVSKADRERLIERHLIPSLEALDLIGDTGRLLDVGSGGGFPAVPIAIAKPELDVTCVESSQRKSYFLRSVSRETLLPNLHVLTARAEDLGQEHDGVYDYVTARAVADLFDLVRWTRRLLTPEGRWILWKGQSWREEGDLEKLKVCLLDERELSDGGRLIVLALTLK